MSTEFKSTWLVEVPVVGILRGRQPCEIASLVSAAVSGGLRNLEITMNSPQAGCQIREAVAAADGRMNIGAGTVTSLALLDEALEAGASFIVTPSLNLDVARGCREIRVPFFPGAFTPTEVLRAWDSGAKAVKIFPADTLGVGYIRALRGPFPNLPLFPTGGVGVAEARAYLEAGVVAVGVGTPLFDKRLMDLGCWSEIERRCANFVEAAKRTG